ncbi:leucine aminopeptidase 2, chloroplastic-like [Lactuca sativa]|uniref:leucine aminopeptidase 2, chloroplastic-like n=1 Tax=Lactuca sativa TaxID=4236 RepID=UPI0022AF73BD|nr:leucine aminopeptidase 2, chloroplastic-like [Lactuca sativa]
MKPYLKLIGSLNLGGGPELEKKLKYTEHVCSGVILGKELVNAPPNVLTPGVSAEEAEKIASTIDCDKLSDIGSEYEGEDCQTC